MMINSMARGGVEAEVRALRDQQQVVDALYRFAAGQDLRDPELFRSAFTSDATLDFTHPARRFGADVPVMVGRQAISEILTTLAPLATTHTVTNPRVILHDDTASLHALVEAQHVLRAAPDRYLLLKNIYAVTLARAPDVWEIRSLVIRNVWHDGDPAVLFSRGTP
ncbi:MAG TPA: nuclear transport factor 2 family protein [Longimicrobiales bacterium]